ncbi:MAG TPA: NADH-quinone oxidoreductase subunit M [Blastocatellia bacterium]|nr:NADH-quinone oxidoreductase subunit M [Blastocatellia bacterium]
MLTILIFLPVAAVGLMLLHESFWGKNDETQKKLALGFTLLNFVLSLVLIAGFKSDTTELQFVQNVPWIKSLGINYHVGVDGISVWLVILTTILFPIAILGSWNSIHKRMREFLFFMLLLESGVIGVFVSFDLFLFYVFWEVMLIPMYFLIGVWGGERRIYAAVKFVLYTMVGSLLMLAGIIALYSIVGQNTFDMEVITTAVRSGQLQNLDVNTQRWLFGAFALAFFIKVPLFPFHTWLPDAHVEAPTAGSVILAGVLLKMGTYGLIRFNLSMFPAASHHYAWIIEILAVIGIIYGALVAMVQPDLKKLIAYSSVSHLGFVVLGIFAFTDQGIQGAVYQMLNHGVSTGALFLLVGVIYDRRHTRLISEFGGLATPMPVYAAFFLWVTFSSIGLPLLNGFVGEFLTLLGTFTSVSIPHPYLYGTFATTGIIWSACYMLWMYQRVFMGENSNPKNQTLTDLSLREKFVLTPLLALTLFMGVYPMYFLRRTEASAKEVQQTVVNAPTEGIASVSPTFKK